MKRIKAAFNTNEPQVTSVLGLTLLNLLALALQDQGWPPLWFILFALLFWTAIALFSNFLDPIPQSGGKDE